MVLATGLVVCGAVKAEETYTYVDGSGDTVKVTKGDGYTIRESTGITVTTFHKLFDDTPPKKESIFDSWLFGKDCGADFRADEADVVREEQKIDFMQGIEKHDQCRVNLLPGQENWPKLGLRDKIDAEFHQVLKRKIAYVKYLKARDNAMNKDEAVMAAYAEYKKARDAQNEQ